MDAADLIVLWLEEKGIPILSVYEMKGIVTIIHFSNQDFVHLRVYEEDVLVSSQDDSQFLLLHNPDFFEKLEKWIT